MSKYLPLRSIAAGSVIGPDIMLDRAGKLAQAAFHHIDVRKGYQV